MNDCNFEWIFEEIAPCVRVVSKWADSRQTFTEGQIRGLFSDRTIDFISSCSRHINYFRDSIAAVLCLREMWTKSRSPLSPARFLDLVNPVKTILFRNNTLNFAAARGRKTGINSLRRTFGQGSKVSMETRGNLRLSLLRFILLSLSSLPSSLRYL
jgi:hypothetical protein